MPVLRVEPMVAMAVLSLLEQAHLELEHVRVGADGRRVDEGGYAVADLLWHRSPFVGPTIWEALRYPLGTLEDELCRAAARAAAGGGRPGYSDVLAWFVLTRLAEALAGQSWVAELQRSLRGLVGPSLWLRPDRELLELPAEAQMTLLARHRGGEVPMVHALTRRTRALVSPYLGALGFLRGRGVVVPGLRVPCARRCRRDGGVPLRGYLGRALECCGRPGQRHAAALEVRAPGTACGRLVGVQAAGGRALGLVRSRDGAGRGRAGGTFLEDPAERRRWCAEQLDAAWAWAASPTRPTGEHQPCRGPAGRTVAWRGDVPTPVEASGVALD
jgi:hypothetical protein